MRTFLSAVPDRTVILIRIMVGSVFLSEGIQKFLFVSELGAGRFAKLGLPFPGLLGPIVGTTEIACGIAVLLGAWLRAAVIPLLVVILAAIATTKVPMLQARGFWAAAHESRADFCMLLGLIFLLVKGAGSWSVDRVRGR
jgi:putative oxidoreductase